MHDYYMSLYLCGVDRYCIAASVSNVCGRRNDALLLHQTSVCGGEDRCIIAVSVISVCRLMTDALLLHQSSMCAEK